MLLEVNEQFTTSASKEAIYESLVSKFDRIANVFRDGNYIKVEGIDSYINIVSAKYRKDSTRISIHKNDDLCYIDASVEYRTSFLFWISNVVGLIIAGGIYLNFRLFLDPYLYERFFTTVVWMYVGIVLCVVVGCIIPIIFYVQQQNRVRTAIETLFQLVKAEFLHPSRIVEPASSNSLPLNFQTDMTDSAVASTTSALPASLGATATRHPVPTAHVLQDDALERVRANGYWAVRVRSAQWTMIGYFQFFVSGVMSLFGIIVLLRGLFTPQDVEALSGIAGLSPWSEYAVALVCFIIAYRMLINGFTTFLQRDELLMRIDVAMNTALMATQMTTLAQHMTALQKNHK